MLTPATSAMRVVVAASSPSRSSTSTVASRIALTVAWARACRGAARAGALFFDISATEPSPRARQAARLSGSASFSAGAGAS